MEKKMAQSVLLIIFRESKGRVCIIPNCQQKSEKGQREKQQKGRGGDTGIPLSLLS